MISDAARQTLAFSMEEMKQLKSRPKILLR